MTVLIRLSFVLVQVIYCDLYIVIYKSTRAKWIGAIHPRQEQRDHPWPKERQPGSTCSQPCVSNSTWTLGWDPVDTSPPSFCCCFHSPTAWKRRWSTAQVPLWSTFNPPPTEQGQGCQSTALSLKLNISAATAWNEGLRSLDGTVIDKLSGYWQR